MLARIVLLVSALSLLAPTLPAQKPLVLAKQGSFFINQEDLATAFPTAAGNPRSPATSLSEACTSNIKFRKSATAPPTP